MSEPTNDQFQSLTPFIIRLCFEKSEIVKICRFILKIVLNLVCIAFAPIVVA